MKIFVHVEGVSVRTGGGGVMQGHGEISFGVSGRQSSHLQFNVQPGKLVWTYEAQRLFP